MYLTASRLYDYCQCPHKVWRDIHGPQEEKIQETNPFVELLWRKGLQHEQKIIEQIGEFLDLSHGSLEERFQKTLDAMKNNTPLIYQGVLIYENLLGIPDLLQKLENGSYIPVEIKSGMGYEGADEEAGEEGRPKKHYAVQLCLYNELLKKLGFASHDKGKILDINSEEVEYELAAPIGVRNQTTFWEFYTQIKEEIFFLMSNDRKNRPALAGICKLCPWYFSCKKWCEKTKDLSNIFYLGRAMRDIINTDLSLENFEDLASINVQAVIQEKKINKQYLRGIGEKLLTKFRTRAVILSKTKTPVLHEPVSFPQVAYELFFDIEDDPTQEFVYLHGIYQRTMEGQRFVSFLAIDVNEESEKRAWGSFWEYIASLPQNDFSVYYFSHHEKTTYKRLQKKYPEIISLDKVEEFFANPNVIDLYRIIQGQTDWPVGSYSLKSLASYLGFDWRDPTPSGVLSIQWFNEFINTKDEGLLQRILEYNEDDCKATMILKDALANLNEDLKRIL